MFVGLQVHTSTLKEAEYTMLLTQKIALKRIVPILGKLSGICYQVNAMSDEVNSRYTTTFKINFNESITYKELPDIMIHITSEGNKYGVVGNYWFDGLAIHINTKIEKGVSKIVYLKQKNITILHRILNVAMRHFTNVLAVYL